MKKECSHSSPMISVTDTETRPSNPTLCSLCVTSVSQTDGWLVRSHCDAKTLAIDMQAEVLC